MEAVQNIRPTAEDPAGAIRAELMECFRKQREAYLEDPMPDYQQRRKDLLALKAMLNENREA
ncbi:MAG: hypothetical protein P8172_16970, partial [Gammaproteobacteria bacterium]